MEVRGGIKEKKKREGKEGGKEGREQRGKGEGEERRERGRGAEKSKFLLVSKCPPPFLYMTLQRT